jgi:hypothetical protein
MEKESLTYNPCPGARKKASELRLRKLGTAVQELKLIHNSGLRSNAS